MAYVSTYIKRKLRSTQRVDSDEQDSTLMRTAEKLRASGWSLDQVSSKLYLGCTDKGYLAAVEAGPAPREFREADLQRRERLKRR